MATQGPLPVTIERQMYFSNYLQDSSSTVPSVQLVEKDTDMVPVSHWESLT